MEQHILTPILGGGYACSCGEKMRDEDPGVHYGEHRAEVDSGLTASEE